MVEYSTFYENRSARIGETMKFSDLNAEQWAELQPYLDTAILPLTGLAGSEMPYEATEALEKLRDILEMFEGPFKGRVVIYPACHYNQGPQGILTEELCRNLRSVGFRYVIAAAAYPINEANKPSSADLIVGLEADGTLPAKDSISEAVRALWLGRA
jgi:23S rRNA (pseudouridine1915-N3)-methyltransferase